MKQPQSPAISARITLSSPLLERNRRQTRRSSSRKSSPAVVVAVAVVAAVATLVANLSSFAEGFSTTTTVAVGGARSLFSQARNNRQRACVAAGEVARSTTMCCGGGAAAAAAHRSDSGGFAPRSSCYNNVGTGSIGTRRIGDSSRHNNRWLSSSVIVSMAHGEAAASTVLCAPTTTMSDDGGGGGNGSSSSSSRSSVGDRRRSSHASGSAAATELRAGDPVEFWHAKGLVLGSYESVVPGRRSLAVRTEAGEALVIDAGQLVGIWLEGEMRGPLPSGEAEWSRVRDEATALLQGMPTRGLDMGPFWRAASSKGKGFLVTAAHAAEFLFAEDRAKLGLKKRKPFQFRGPGEGFTPNAVERAAAAHVLAGELSRFKRVVSRRLDEHKPPRADKMMGADDGASVEEGQEGVFVSLGGFKAVDQSVAVTREVADFCRVVKFVREDAAAEGGEEGGGGGRRAAAARGELYEPAFLLILHSLEAFAIGGDARSLTPEAKRVMEDTGKPTQAAAKAILVDVGLWTRKHDNRDGVGSYGGAGGGEEAGGAAGVIPWPAETLEAASELAQERVRRGVNYDKRPPQGVVGAPAPFGRHDFRGANFGVYCIDGPGTSFLDDAFSIDPETREVFVHITDVQGMVPQASVLDDVARLRAASEYLPQGPLFMMPPSALKAMSFSDRETNEAVTVGFRLDPRTGALESSRVMLTTLPPAVPLTFEQADRLLENSEVGGEAGSRLGRVAAEIRALEYLSRRSAEAGGRRRRGKEGVRLRTGRRGQVEATEVPKSRSLSLVDELLTVYTLEVYGVCKKAGVALPSLVGQQDRVAAGRSRYGTGPLRRYIDILAQRQVAAILRGTGYLGKKYLMETASYLTWRQNKTRARRQEEAGRLSLEALAAHCQTQMRATGLPHAIVPARGTGKGREVRLDGLGVVVHAKRAPGSGGRGVGIERGEVMRVMIERVDLQLKQVVATEYSGPER